MESCPEGISSHETARGISLQAAITSPRARIRSHETAVTESLTASGDLASL